MRRYRDHVFKKIIWGELSLKHEWTGKVGGMAERREEGLFKGKGMWKILEYSETYLVFGVQIISLAKKMEEMVRNKIDKIGKAQIIKALECTKKPILPCWCGKLLKGCKLISNATVRLVVWKVHPHGNVESTQGKSKIRNKKCTMEDYSNSGKKQMMIVRNKVLSVEFGRNCFMTYLGSRIWIKFRLEEEREFKAPFLVFGLWSWADGETITREGACLDTRKICPQGCCLQLSTWCAQPSSWGILTSWSDFSS